MASSVVIHIMPKFEQKKCSMWTLLQTGYSGPQKSWPRLPCISYGRKGHNFCDPLYIFIKLRNFRAKKNWPNKFKVVWNFSLCPPLRRTFSERVYGRLVQVYFNNLGVIHKVRHANFGHFLPPSPLCHGTVPEALTPPPGFRDVPSV